MLRDAAALIMLRDSATGIEVCMLRRVTSSRFAAGAYVFPGGSVDPLDSQLASTCLVNAAAEESSDSAYKIAAIRETFEEAGLLTAAATSELNIKPQLREKLHQGEIGLEQLLLEAGMQLNLASLVFYDHWITPEAAPIRFDTRFYLSIAPEGQQLLHDEKETDSSCWAKPSDILALYDKKDVKLMPVTHVQLTRLAGFDNVDEVMQFAAGQGDISPTMPVIGRADDGKGKIVKIDLREGAAEYPVFK
ncbi:MAG: NUDIX domain-containing protein [Cycloclasticus sp.]